MADAGFIVLALALFTLSDPHIAPANAALQAARVAAARDVDVERVRGLIVEHTDRPALGILGRDAVNVVELNLALDDLT